MRLEFHPKADRDLIEAAAYYERKVPGLGERFAAEVERVIDLLLDYPQIGVRVEGELRGFALYRFPYSVIYSVSPEVLRIVVVANHHRRPGYWRSRIEH